MQHIEKNEDLNTISQEDLNDENKRVEERAKPHQNKVKFHDIAASLEIKGDSEIVLEAVKKDGVALQYASREIQLEKVKEGCGAKS